MKNIPIVQAKLKVSPEDFIVEELGDKWICKISEKFNVAFLGDIPIEPSVGVCGDAGESFLENHGQTPAAVAFEKAVEGMNLALEQL